MSPGRSPVLESWMCIPLRTTWTVSLTSFVSSVTAILFFSSCQNLKPIDKSTITMRITKVALCAVAIDMMARTVSSKLKGLRAQPNNRVHHRGGLADDNTFGPYSAVDVEIWSSLRPFRDALKRWRHRETGRFAQSARKALVLASVDCIRASVRLRRLPSHRPMGVVDHHFPNRLARGTRIGASIGELQEHAKMYTLDGWLAGRILEPPEIETGGLLAEILQFLRWKGDNLR